MRNTVAYRQDFIVLKIDTKQDFKSCLYFVSLKVFFRLKVSTLMTEDIELH